MFRHSTLVVILLALAAGSAAAGPDDPIDLIGMDPAQLIAALGTPREIFTWRAAEPIEDDIVFFYPDFRYVFWFQSRVWQVRFDNRYAGTVLGFSIGMRRSDVEAVGRGTLQESADSLFLSLDTGRYPMRVRLAMLDDRVDDIYVYRSDW